MRVKAAQMQKGYNGERKLDYHVRSLPDNFTVLNDITLRLFDKKFQMDTVILSALAIYIIEVKSYEGTVTFDTSLKQCLQHTGEKLLGYKYPITQVEMNVYHLMRWLQNRGLAGIPIYYFIAFAEQSTIIHVKGEEESIKKVMAYVEEIPLRVMKMDASHSKQKTVNQQLKNRIVNAILSECEDFTYDVLEEFNINKQQIQPGIHCPQCRKLGMKRAYGRWQCPSCNTNSKDAHNRALQDYFLLFGDTITNKQCREFLGVNSRYLATRILQNLNFITQKSTQNWIFV